MALLGTFHKLLGGPFVVPLLEQCRSGILEVYEWLHKESPDVQTESQAITSSQKQIVHQKNLESSHLYRLPTELLCLVDNDLDATGYLAIRATCSTFRDRLGAPKYVSPDEKSIAKAKAKMTEWMIRQLYPTLCERERRIGALIRNGEEFFLCQPCATRHPSEFFTREQLEAGAENRRCRGQQRVFRLCKHLTVDFNTMKRPLEPLKYYTEIETERGPDFHVYTAPGRIDCVKCREKVKYADFFYAYRNSTTLTQESWRRRAGKSYSHMRELYPHLGFSWKQVSLSNLSEELAGDDTPLCPHVSMRDINLDLCYSRTARLKYSGENHTYFWSNLRDSERQAALRRGEDIISGECRTKDCPLKFSFHWRDIPVRLALDVRFDFPQSMTSPQDPRWLAITYPLEGEDKENLFTLEDLNNEVVCRGLGL
ncbi:hypothetical protein HDK90DRAFT_548752 [Phyllosticta capitalensis]|uniref:F-box domain-containing protein n=1 Tax=Phyllosticta capitalensis TaxID=121624 RepID=A0ABR1YX13_9PEZI